MHPALAKSFGGLSRAYYVRQFLFALLFAAFMGAMLSGVPNARGAAGVTAAVVLTLCTLLYPYARFVYEGIVGYVVGRNAFILPLPLWLGAKVMTMAMCYFGAIFIAPIGLVYLYLRNR